MNNYFVLIPQELISEIFNYVTDYDSFVTLFELSNMPDKSIKIYIKNRITLTMPEIVDIIIPDYTLDVEYIISTYLMSIKYYSQSKDYLDYMIDEINKIIQKYYPNANIWLLTKQPEITIADFDDKDNTDIRDIISEHSFELDLEGTLNLPTKILKLIQMKFDIVYYTTMMKDLSVNNQSWIYLLINQYGFHFGLRDRDDNLYDLVEVSYGEILMIIFVINYNISIGYVKYYMKKMNNR